MGRKRRSLSAPKMKIAVKGAVTNLFAVQGADSVCSKPQEEAVKKNLEKYDLAQSSQETILLRAPRNADVELKITQKKRKKENVIEEIESKTNPESSEALKLQLFQSLMGDYFGKKSKNIFSPIDYEDESEHLQKDIPSNLLIRSIEIALSNRNILYILGQSGIGKTTICLEYIAGWLNANKNEESFPLLIYMDLSMPFFDACHKIFKNKESVFENFVACYLYENFQAEVKKIFGRKKI
jgi:hypothetical protein